jgi:DtxR family transcriptional regulator, Mn-dependent transcriptional regulator
VRSISTEDYLKAAYKLEEKGIKTTTSALAAELDVADASITAMIKKLSHKGLLKYKRYQGVELTTTGRKMALSILRRHRLWEMFLVKFLGYSWDAVHDEAERLEHVTSDDLEQRLDDALGFPTVDPHGDPIPNKRGDIAKSIDQSLAECAIGDSLRISRVSDENSAMLKHASAIGIRLHAKLTVMEKKIFDGSMLVKVGARSHFVSKGVAQAVFVHKL